VVFLSRLRARRILGGIAGLVVTASAGASFVAAPAYAVTGGSPITEAGQKFAVKVRIGDIRGCSGALVARSWVITLKSCLANGSQPVADGAPAQPTTATINGHGFPVIEVVTRADRDVALLRLPVQDRDDPEIWASGVAPQAGETLRIAGYGRTATQWAPDQAQVGQVTVDSVTATTFTVVDPAGAVNTCMGDAGGPAYRLEVSGLPKLVGLHSGSWQRGCLAVTDTRQGTTETRVDDLGSWINDTEARSYALLARANGKYVTAENAGAAPLIADRTDVTIWALYEMIDQHDGYVALRSRANGKYVCAENAGAAPLIANRAVVGVWEEFKFVDDSQGDFSLLARANGKYVTAENAGGSALIANRTAIGPWETFTFR
jgi:Trypsin